MKKDLFMSRIFTALTFLCAILLSALTANAYQPIVTIGKPPLEDIQYSPDGRYLVTLASPFIEFLDTETLEPVSKIYIPENFTTDLKISPDNSLIAFRSEKNIYIIEVASGSIYAIIPVDFTNSYEFSPDGRYFAYIEVSKDSVFLWDIKQKKVIKELTGDPEPLIPDPIYCTFAIAFHPKGKILAVASRRNTIALWNIETNEISSHLQAINIESYQTYYRKLEFSNDGNWLVAQNGNSVAKYELSTGRSATIISKDVASMAITPDSNYILTGDGYGKLYISNIRTGYIEEREAMDRTPPPNMGTATVSEIAVSPDGKRIACVLNNSRLVIWNTKGFTRIKSIYGWIGAYSCAAYLPKVNRIVAAGLYQNELLFFNATTGELESVVDYYFGVECIVPSPDGTKIAVCAEEFDRIYDGLTGKELHKFQDRNGHTKIFAFSPSGKYLASNGWKGTYIYDMRNYKLVKHISNEWLLNNSMMFFTYDEKKIIIMPEDNETKKIRMEFWDIESGELVDQKSYAGPMIRLGKDFIQARAKGDETEIYLFNSGKRISKIPVKLPASWQWDEVFHPSGNILALPTQTERIYIYNYNFYNPWTGKLLTTVPTLFSIVFADDNYIFMKDDKLQLGLYHISDIIGTEPNIGYYGKILTQLSKIKNELLPNYPNPFNPDTWIPYQLGDDAEVIIKIYKESGELIRTLNLGHRRAGKYISKEESAYWDGKNEYGEDASSGIYFYTIQAGNYSSTRKMILLK